MSSSNYWRKRQADHIQNSIETAVRSSEELSKLYQKSCFYFNEHISGIFEKYKTKYGLSQAEAKNLLNSLKDPTSYDEMLSKLKSSKGNERKELLKELEAPAYRYRINKFQEAQRQLDSLMNNVYKQEKEINTLTYIDVAYNAYYDSIYSLQQRTGIAFNFDTIDPELVDKLLNSKWSGKNYSERIWNNTQQVADSVKEEMLMGALTGKTEKEMIATITERFAVGLYSARRLIYTESDFISNALDLEAYKEAGVTKVRFCAVHDLKTSKICQEHDRKIVEISKAVQGKNVPPMHPNCRSTTEPVINEEVEAKMKRRVRDSATGNDKIVSANQTYDEWLADQQKEHGIDTIDTLTKKVKNAKTDRKQYNNYTLVIGKENMPKTFAKFQDLKYNNGDEWDKLKETYRDVNWQRKALAKHSSGELHKVPYLGEPNSVFDNYRNGIIQQRRYYGKTGKPRLDIDMTDHGNPKEHPVVPHYHEWFEIGDDKVKRDTSSDKKLKRGHVIANEDILKKDEEGENE